ncbi:MAG: sulfotransferase family protein [Planctomycetes bacterium]|nr:sulfotransferase family protein [Planctomycetota bacterium]
MKSRADAQALQDLLQRNRFAEALEAAETWVARQPRTLAAWVALARAALGMGLLGRADQAAAMSITLAPQDREVRFYRALIDHRLSRTDAAIAGFRPLITTSGPFRLEASILLAEALQRCGRMDEFREHLDAGGEWQRDPRAVLHVARRQAMDDPAAAADRLRQVALGEGPEWIRRFAGFDAVRLLDELGRFREALELALHVHGSTEHGEGTGSLERSIESQRRLMQRPGWCTPRAPRVHGLALVVAMPRSGTTLLEQMLDRHPSISGIGEYEGMQNLGAAMEASGHWPDGLGELPEGLAMDLQRSYLEGARQLARPGTRVMFDKTLLTWSWLPAVAAVLPGAVGLHMARDPRDTAISLLLNNFNAGAFGWTHSLDGIRRAIELERSLLPQALDRLGIPSVSIVYERLVQDPETAARRCLDALGLPMDPAVLKPQENRRAVHTLSHEQVRRPINPISIGRWRNYAWAFDASWDPLVRLHEARLAEG